MNIIQKIRKKIEEQRLAYLSERNNEKSVIDDLGDIDNYPRNKKKLYSWAGFLTFLTSFSFDIYIVCLLATLADSIMNSLSIVIFLSSVLIGIGGLFFSGIVGLTVSEKLHRKHFKKEYPSLTDEEQFRITKHLYSGNWTHTVITDEILNLTKIALSSDQYTQLRMENKNGVSYQALNDALDKKEAIDKIKQEQQEVSIDIEELKQVEEIAYH
jgi:hypothetical protein